MELTLHDPLLELLAHLTIGSVAHAAIYGPLQDRAFVLNGGAFKDVVAQICHSLLSRLLGLHNMMLFVRQRGNTVLLMAEPRGQLAMPLQHLFR
jgi:hypothetical protein